MKELFLAWQDPVNRGWYPVGKLTADDNDNYEFVYTRGSLASERFRPLGQMKDLHKRYRSDELFPLFANRLLSRNRPEYKKLLKWIDLAKDEDHPIQILARTEGIRRTDTLTVFPHPVPEKDGTYRIHFFSHGVRYLTPEALDMIGNLEQGAPLFLHPDEQNESDEYALLLQTGSPATSVGYCPRYLACDLRQILGLADNSAEVQLYVEQVNEDAPLQLRLLCTLEAPWPDDFKPCTSEYYTPLA